MKRILKDYFSFSRNERNGISLLLLIILALLIAIPFSNYIFKSKPSDFSAFNKDVAEFRASLDSTSNGQKQIYQGKSIPVALENNILIDPNFASDQDLIKVGLTDHQVHILRNYLSKGGKIRKPEDIKKIYGITDSQYFAILPHLKIESKIAGKAFQPDFKKPARINSEITRVELNSADTLAFLKIPGIGKVFTNRIINYRNQLRGFCNKNQLLEVYGIDTAMFRKISPAIFIDTLKLKKINLNTSAYEDFKHPYLNSYQIKGILKYRQFKGKIANVDELLKNNLLPREVYNRIKPYLSAGE